jgi:hypothetical protein
LNSSGSDNIKELVFRKFKLFIVVGFKFEFPIFKFLLIFYLISSDVLIIIKKKQNFFKFKWGLGIGDGGLGIGDWGLGIGPNPQSPIPNPQSPIPNPQSPFEKILLFVNYK